MPSDAQKDSLRSRVSAARSRVTDGEWSAVSRAMTRSALNFADARPTATVALYASRAAEPETGELITELARRGWRVLLPVIRRAVDWAEFGGWELSRVRLYTDGSRRVLLKRKKTAHHVPEPGI